MSASVTTVVRPSGPARAIADAFRVWRRIPPEMWVAAAMLAIAERLAVTGMVFLKSGFRGFHLPALLDAFAGSMITSFCLLLALALADRAVDNGARPFVAYGTAAVLGVVVGTMLATTLWLFHMYLGDGMLIRYGKGLPYSYVHITHPINSLLGWLCYSALATAVYADVRSVRKIQAQLHEARLQRTAQARRLLESQLQAMQARVEPQFLFDTLAQVRSLHDVEPAAADSVLDNLIDFLHAALAQARIERSTLRHEIEIVEAYLSIVKSRMGSRLAFAVDIPRELFDAVFPAMLLMPLVDNAIRHGIEPMRFGGRIDVSADRRSSRLKITVTDAGVGIPKNIREHGGLETLRQRLAQLFGDSGRLTFEANEPHGIKAVIEVPFEERTLST